MADAFRAEIDATSFTVSLGVELGQWFVLSGMIAVHIAAT